MAQRKMSADVMALVAERFKALSEPARLQILSGLRGGERSVTELVASTGLGQANVSKHLQALLAAGFVERRKEGLFAYYALADTDVFTLCDIMCGRLDAELSNRRKVIRGR